MGVQIVKLLDPLNPTIVTGGLVPRGAYNAGTAYVVGDSVSYNGSSYVCILASTGNLPTNTTYWQVLAEMGATGATGTPGLDITWLGAYSGGTTYAVNDAVSYNGSSYICKLISTGNLPTNTTYWDVMALKGADGGAYAVTTVSSPSYTVTRNSGEEIILTTYTGGDCTVSLSSAVGNTAKLDIRKSNGSSYLTIIDGFNSETINSSATKEIQYQNTSVTLASDGANWVII